MEESSILPVQQQQKAAMFLFSIERKVVNSVVEEKDGKKEAANEKAMEDKKEREISEETKSM